MADSHSGRDGVRVDDDVRCDSLAGERHVLRNKNKNVTVTVWIFFTNYWSWTDSTSENTRSITLNLISDQWLHNKLKICVSASWFNRFILILCRQEAEDVFFTSCLYWIPQVPFCPWRLANLSPIWGIRTERTCIIKGWNKAPSHSWNMIYRPGFITQPAIPYLPA